MSEENISSHARGLMIKISIMIGWQLPEQQEARNILYDQFTKKIIEDYGSLNVQELEFAIRSTGSGIKDWGKNINLSLIDQAVQPYLAKRAEIRRLEEKELKHPMVRPEEVVLMNDDELIEFHKDLFLRTKSIGLIPFDLYQKLVDKGELDLTVEEKKKIKAQVETRLENEAAQDGLKAQKELRHEQNHYPDKFEKRVIRECYKQAVAAYFIKQSEMDNFLNEE